MSAVRRYWEVKRLLGRGLTEAQVGVRLGIAQCTVSRILSLKSLLPSFRFEFCFCDDMTFSAARCIASYSADAQRASRDELCKMFRRAAKAKVRILRRDVEAVMQRFGRDLDRAPFPVKSCIGCTARTGAHGDLFGACDSMGRCLKPSCWARKVNAVKARQSRWAGKEGGGE